MTEHPTIVQELERKTLAELERVMWSLEKKKISVASAYAAVRALWEITSGLVPTETMNLIAQASTELEKSAQEVEMRVLVDGEKSAVLNAVSGGVNIFIRRHADVVGKIKTIRTDTNELFPEEWAFHKMEEVANQLQNKGMNRIV
jgi:predicted nuclease with TOPRIM domain